MNGTGLNVSFAHDVDRHGCLRARGSNRIIGQLKKDGTWHLPARPEGKPTLDMKFGLAGSGNATEVARRKGDLPREWARQDTMRRTLWHADSAFAQEPGAQYLWSAFDSVVGEELLNFAEAADNNPEFVRALPRFVSRVGSMLTSQEMHEHLSRFECLEAGTRACRLGRMGA